MAALGGTAFSQTETPSDVPITLDSMSWVAKPLPAKSTSIQPSRTSRATSGPAPVWITAGPHTASILPPVLAARMRAATSPTSRPFGFSDETSDAMNSNGLAPRGRSGGAARARRRDRRRSRSPARTRCIGAVRRRPSASRTTAQSISGFSTSTQWPPMPDRRRQVGGGVEARGQDAVGVAGNQPRVLDGHAVGAVHLQLGQKGGEDLLVVGDDLDAGPARVGVGLADLHVDDAVVGAGRDDHVEHLGQDQRVDDVALDLDDLAGHQPTLGALGVTVSGSSSETGSSSAPTVGSSFSSPFRWS